jgi:hypothetical protein
MAVMSAEERRRVWAYLMRQGDPAAVPGVSKTDLRAAVDAADGWIEANSAAFNSALPAAYRTASTTPQKTMLLCWVAMRRAGLLRVDEDDVV